MRRIAATLVLLLSAGASPAAEDARQPAAASPAAVAAGEEAAIAAIAAFDAHDDAALRVLAWRDYPDPWLVADALCGRERYDVADAFAKAAPREDTESLPAYVVGQRADPTPESVRLAFRAVMDAVRDRRDADLLSASESIDLGRADVATITIAAWRGAGLARSSRLEDAIRQHEAVVERASALGWGARANASRASIGKIFVMKGLDAWSRGESEAALALAREGVERTRVPGRDADVRLASMQLGALLTASGMLDEAIRTFEAAAGENSEAAELFRLRGLASAYQNAGRTSEALDLWSRLVDLSEKDPQSQAAALTNCARILSFVGRHDEAATSHLRAIEIFRLAGETLDEAGVIFALAVNEFRRGRTDEVRALSARLQELAAVVPDDKRGSVWGDLVELLLYVDDDETALRVGEQWVEWERRPEGRAQLGAALLVLGRILIRTDRQGDVIAVLREALPLLDGEGRTKQRAEALFQLGSAEVRSGDRKPGLAHLEEAIALARATSNRDVLVDALGVRATSSVADRDWSTALACAKEGERLVHESFRGMGMEASATGRARTSHDWVNVMGRMAALFLESPPELLHFGEAARASSLLEALGGRGAVDGSAPSEALREARTSAAAREAEAARRLREATESGNRGEVAACREALDLAREQVLAVAARIEREVGRTAGFAVPEPVTSDRLGLLLEANDVFVMYERLRGLGFYAVVRDAAGLRCVELGEGLDIDDAIEAARVEKDRPVDTEALARLRKFFVDRLDLPPTVERMIVSPMAPVTFVPFGLLASGLDIAYVPSGTTLEWLTRGAGPPGTGVLAVGDPKYGGARQEAAAQSRGSAMRLAPLPATRDEARGIGTVVLLSENATEGRLWAELAKQERWRAVHLAGHALGDERRPALSALALTPTDADDGFLTVAEVMGRRVPADLVVLSACETARGRDYAGEGVFGLTSAFMIAGSPRVICSLWKVDDDATRALMLRFYELWNPKDGKTGLPPARALRTAQEFVRSHAKWEHPHFWAAWQLWGLPD